MAVLKCRKVDGGWEECIKRKWKGHRRDVVRIKMRTDLTNWKRNAK